MGLRKVPRRMLPASLLLPATPVVESLLATHERKPCIILITRTIHTHKVLSTNTYCVPVQKSSVAQNFFESVPKDYCAKPWPGLSASHPRQGTRKPPPKKFFIKICPRSPSDPRPVIETPLSVLGSGVPPFAILRPEGLGIFSRTTWAFPSGRLGS